MHYLGMSSSRCAYSTIGRNRERELMKRVAVGAVILAAVALVLAPGSAHATSIVFNISPTCPALTSACGGLQIAGSNASGFNIRIGSVTVSGAPTNNGTFAVSSNLTGLGGNGDLVFNSVTNSISITGAISGLGVAQTTLLNGSFSTFNVLFSTLSSGEITATGPDVKAASLLSAIGLNTNTKFNFFGFVLGFNKTAPLGSYDVINANIVNQTPEPETLLLFGTGLVSLVGLLRRKGLSRT
jgi:PEP-CTERM motif